MQLVFLRIIFLISVAALLCINFMPSQFHTVSPTLVHTKHQLTPEAAKFELDFKNHLILTSLIFIGINLLFVFWIALTRSIPYLPFRTPLNLCEHRINTFSHLYRWIELYSSLSILVLLFDEDFFLINVMMSYMENPFSYRPSFSPGLYRIKLPLKIISFILIFGCATSQVEHYFCISIILSFFSTFPRRCPWIPFLLILMANDIQLNPGPRGYHENFFSFMNWNLNSLPKNDFERIKLIEAHNSNFNYDIISLCETSLRESTDIPDPLMDGYTFYPANHPEDSARGGVGLLYKDTLPLTLRHDLAFSESIVAEFTFGRKFFLPFYIVSLQIKQTQLNSNNS